MDKLNGIQKFLLTMIVLITSIILILKICGGSFITNLGYDAMLLLKYSIIDYPIETIKNVTNDFASLWQVKEENDLLRYELSQNPSYKAKYEEERRKNREYEEALALMNSDELYESIWANVILRDQSTYNDQITINKGSKDGIKEGMAVETTKGMIGKIDSVREYSSVVKLLTCEDKTTSASIKVNLNEKQSVDGVLQGYDINSGLYVIYLYEDIDGIKKGMQVVTSGMGKGYPSGLLIGEIEQVKTLSNQSGITIYAKPVDDFQGFSIVRVILNGEQS